MFQEKQALADVQAEIAEVSRMLSLPDTDPSDDPSASAFDCELEVDLQHLT